MAEEFGYGGIEIEVLEYLLHLSAESVDIRSEVEVDVRRIVQECLQREAAGVVEFMVSGSLSQYGHEFIFGQFVEEALVGGIDILVVGCEDTVHASQDDEGQ